tara:strand:+ start:122 stop:502 length:381 start_codon:yes stop_codon:yes gene_type:complete
MSLVITKPELSEDQKELLSELESMSFLKTEEEYLWFLNELKDLGIETVNDWDDRYSGTYEGREEVAGAEFAQQMAEDCGEIPSDLPSWIDIDWKGSWYNLRFDYSTIERVHKVHGYVIETFFFNNY